ncbi:succinate dehydrogenase assembly factor 2 [Aquibium carbonis]|nr:succinate dehydrogenase assembly factor 2 [Aquibium carbonis]
MISSGTLSIRRKKALYRAQHRGMREMDLLLGTFAAASLDQMSAAELDEFEGLLDILDADFLKWLTGEEPVPARHDTDLFRRIRAFRQVMPF